MSQLVLFDGPLAGQVHEIPPGVTAADLKRRIDFHSPDFCERHVYEVTEADGDLVCTWLRTDPMSAAEAMRARIADRMAQHVKQILELVQESAETAKLDECNVAAWAQAGLYVFAALTLQSVDQPAKHTDDLVHAMIDASRAWYQRLIQRN